MTTRVGRDLLLGILKRNRAEHAETYEKAVEKYRSLAIQEVEKQCERLKKSKRPVRIVVMLPIPERHLDDYDRIIRMVELDVRTEIDLDESDAQKYLMNNWEWQRSFLSNTTSYVHTEDRTDEEEE